MSSKLHPSYPSTKKGGLVTRIFGFALSSFAALGVAFFVNQADSPKMLRAADTEESVTHPDFTKETEPEAGLTFTLTSSSLTETNNSFRVTARSGTISTIKSSSRAANDSIYLTVEDENWTDWETATTAGQTAYDEAQEAGTEYTPARYSAYVYNIDTANSNDDVLIPEEVRSPTLGDSYYFILDVVGIHANACAQYSAAGEEGEISYGDTASISIPKSVTHIEAGAFPGATNIAFNIESTQEEVGEGYEEGWTDSTSITYGASYSHNVNGAHPVGLVNNSKNFGVASDYCLGSQLQLEGHDEWYQPMWITYDVLDASGNTVSEDNAMMQPVTNTILNVDAVGSNVGGSSLSISVDFAVPNGCHVDPESILFHNIYGASSTTIDGRSYTHPVTDSGPYYVRPVVSFSETVNISDYLTYEAGNAVSFGDYISFSIKLAVKNSEVYQKLCPSQYRTHQARIESGDLTIRVLFDSLGIARYRFVYDVNGEEVTSSFRVTTPIDYSMLDDGTTFTFLVNKSDVGEGFSYASLKELYFENFNIKIDLYNSEDNNVENASAYTTRFGSLSLLPAGKDAIGSVDLITIMIWVYIIFAIVMLVASIIIYFVMKEKYKNDEFRRVNGRKFIQTALKNILGIFLILSSLMFITFRWGFLNNSITVYNPVDIWVIIFTIAGAIALGLFIRDAVVAIKLNRERKNKERLHLDEDVVDDGTK